MGIALGHPTLYPATQVEISAGELPQFRSFHIHVMFQKEFYSDSCTGYDEALDLRQKFMKQFGLEGDVPCTGDFDQGRLCMFPVALSPFGPFPGPQWAAFVPVQDYFRTATWIVQNRGPFDVFIHPNTGFERNDHHDWGVWAGRAWPLDLTSPEFKPELPDLFNASCRSKEPERTIEPQSPMVLDPNSAHVRFFNLANRDFSSLRRFDALNIIELVKTLLDSFPMSRVSIC